MSVPPTIFRRIFAEFKLCRSSKTDDQIICFGNLPLLFPCRGKSYLFFQNMVLLKKNAYLKFPWKEKLKHQIERFWLHLGISAVEKVLVQSETVRQEFLCEFPFAKVSVVPFVEELPPIPKIESKEFDFVYVSSGDPHKNHKRLFEAWQILASQNIFPSLVVTVNDCHPQVLEQVRVLQTQNIKLHNKPGLSHSQVLSLYGHAKALIFPSLTESFGLPLIEADHAGIPIVASELDYVRECVTPAESFDPNSAKSIARAVKRFMKIQDKPQKIYSPKDFLEIALNK
ncbi:MAG: hypothetical protein A2622_10985 [Bdellovibrionales bacterium RIFCSPHIGHO2_01_FULL_40_29]|nr:MAG: hypothetical protein A2622_10985 [Bdellovibrionales bacterium RIFCSPHIGHO2_01_FULL_40_29]OFZ34478.1 MAG: hypothetical protein A3D17_01250 [Bdellovibrionales bacterium RIFCSPHIGHO2_02_FULL_40_15]